MFRICGIDPGSTYTGLAYLDLDLNLNIQNIHTKLIFSGSNNNLNRDNDLDFISKDCDGYYFVNYLAILQYIPPMIGKSQVL